MTKKPVTNKPGMINWSNGMRIFDWRLTRRSPPLEPNFEFKRSVGQVWFFDYLMPIHKQGVARITYCA